MKLKIITYKLQAMNTPNQQLINDIETNLPIVNDKIKDGIEEFKNYLEGLKDEKFEEIEYETEEDAIKRAESIYDRLDEMIKRNELSNKKALDIIKVLNKMTDLFNGIVNNTEDEKEKLALRNNELIDIIIDLERRKTNKLIDQNPKRKKTYNGMFGDDEDEWNEHRINYDVLKKKNEEKRKRIEENRTNQDEMEQIEKWTRMKIGNIIFDSDVDDWNVNTSVFDQKIKNESNLIFLIEDDDGNKFGGYINAEIDKYDDFINDPKSFVFSLKSNGRLNGMLKFDIHNPQYAFYLYNQSDNRLFRIGNDIGIYKENYKSLCYQSSFNYNGIEDALCGKQTFIPKRITAIKLKQIPRRYNNGPKRTYGPRKTFVEKKEVPTELSDNLIFIRNIACTVKDEDLKEMFKPFNVVSAKVVTCTFRGNLRSKGYGYVEVKSAEDQKAAVEKLNGSTQNERVIGVFRACKKQEEAPTTKA